MFTYSSLQENMTLQEGSVNKQDLNDILNVNYPSTFAFEMDSDAMKEAGILKGDKVFCRRDIEPENGDLLIVIIDNKFLIRRWLYTPEPILRAFNDNVEDIQLLKVDNVTVFGVVSALIRRYN